ncbi:30S ribosomal protein THX [Pseudofulvimonas gallinarii]|jgi:ribosomal small subunit protein bTHX|uniref:30S ribosomal protein S31 n=1 Tax=Pseudofulvimonas gallinarii TaxID=634155 RepID=A0A4S3L185_9GAMM|nr:30S ribosomal protein THX [Pseudofulvimonas gallinarii]TCS96362.1 30S ribosomal protein S31 [Pseudofulvimonas gallinarii]THD14728.1 ribosomal small subunit protein bTHX [Pseudofulvimonas gallinarii]
MGKGDKSTRRGKISAGSYGIARPHKAKAAVATKAAAKPAAKTAARKKA